MMGTIYERVEKIKVLPTTTISESVVLLDRSGMGILAVCDNSNKLIGVVTDGDIRRAILKSIPFDSKIEQICNSQPLITHKGVSRLEALRLMDSGKPFLVNHLPVVDEQGILVALMLRSDVSYTGHQRATVVLMAGGLGTRLRPLTDVSPKPLLKIGGKPILETIIENFREYGFNSFFISVNYRAEQIVDYFGNGSRWGVQIQYLQEDKQMGTAGALGLLMERPAHPIIVMNGDLLTKVHFGHLLDFHLEHHATATMCVREYDFQVPYGVVRVDRHKLIGIDEKPVQRFFVNAGIYVLEPKVLDLIPQDFPLDMPTLFDQLLECDLETIVFPVREYWVDIGQLSDFERADGEYFKVFA